MKQYPFHQVCIALAQVDLIIHKYYFECIIQEQTKRIWSPSVCFFLKIAYPFIKFFLNDIIQVRCMYLNIDL